MKKPVIRLKSTLNGIFIPLVALFFAVSGSSIAGGMESDDPDNQLTIKSPDQLTDGVIKLQQLLIPLNSFSAHFEQFVYAPDGYQLQKSSGNLKALRPGKIYWASDAPMEQLVIADGKTLWVYDPDLEQVAIRPFQKDISNTPAVLFVGALDKLSDFYQVTYEVDQNTQLFTLLPINSNSLYSKMSMGFNRSIPVSMDLWDSLGQHTSILFSDSKLNPEIASELFDFVPPAGVDILINEDF